MIKLKKQTQSNQSGMTAIMLAMFLAIVVSLLAVGFATLVRKDQAETLDKTLSYQAQYAAESGVNKAISFIDENPIADGNGNCADITSEGNTFKSSFNIGQANVTCATWDKDMDRIEVSPSTTVAEMASFTEATEIEVSWASSGGYGNGKLNALPSILNNEKRVLSLTITDKSNLRERQRFYLVPWNNNDGTQGYVSRNGEAPRLLQAQVIPDSGVASVKINGFSDRKEYLINAQFLNGDSSTEDVSITKAPRSPGFVNTSQYKIDVNARSQDITKRVIVYYTKTGLPGPAYSVNLQNDGIICKDYQLDGNQNPFNKASEGSVAGCPNI